MWFSKNNFNPEYKTAVVFGASQGLGADIALRLYQRKCGVVLVARTEDKLKEQVARIRGQTTSVSQPTSAEFSSESTPTPLDPLLEYSVCDIADYDSCVKLWDHLLNTLEVDPDFVFCCAGNSVPKLFGDLTGKELASGVNTNYLTAANAVHSGFKAVLQKNAGELIKTFKLRHVILFSSVTAPFPFIGYSQYAPMKAAVSALSLVLRQELMSYNYRVSCVYAGNFASEGFYEEEKTKPEITKVIEGPSDAMSPLDCCDMIFDKLAKGYDSIYTDFIGWVLGLSVLGTQPRNWGFFQVLMLLLFLIAEPIAFIIFVVLPIRKYLQPRVPVKQ